jgi:hypothetical protein
MSAKMKPTTRLSGSVKAKSAKQPVQAKMKVVAVAKRRAKARSAAAAPAVKTRSSLVGAKIYPASVEPSKRAKKVVAALAGPSFAA